MAQLNIKTGTTRKPLELPTPAQWENVYKTLEQKIKAIRGKYGHQITLKLLLPAFLQGHYQQWIRGRHLAHFYNPSQAEMEQIQGVPITWEAPTLAAYLYDVLVIPGYDGMDISYRLPIWDEHPPVLLPELIQDTIEQALLQLAGWEKGGPANNNPRIKQLKDELLRKYLGTC